MTIISYVCENGDITKEIVVNEYPFDERLSVFSTYMMPLAKYIDNIHNVIDPEYSCAQSPGTETSDKNDNP